MACGGGCSGPQRQPLKKLDVDPETLLKLLHREGCAAGRPIQAHRCSRTRPDATASGWRAGRGTGACRISSRCTEETTASRSCWAAPA